MAGKHPNRNPFFSADEREFYAAKLLIFIFFQSCQRAWEYESQSDPQQDRPGGSRTASKGFSQATFSCDAHTIKKKKKKRFLDLGPVQIFRGGFHCPLWSCFLLLGFSFDSKVLFYVLWHKKITPLIFRDFINLQKKTESTIKIIDL